MKLRDRYYRARGIVGNRLDHEIAARVGASWRDVLDFQFYFAKAIQVRLVLKLVIDDSVDSFVRRRDFELSPKEVIDQTRGVGDGARYQKLVGGVIGEPVKP